MKAQKRHLPGCPCADCPKLRLRCGCVRFVQLCPEGESLWEAVAAAHTEGRRSGDFTAFEAAMAANDAHYATAAEAAEQPALLMEMPMA